MKQPWTPRRALRSGKSLPKAWRVAWTGRSKSPWFLPPGMRGRRSLPMLNRSQNTLGDRKTSGERLIHSRYHSAHTGQAADPDGEATGEGLGGGPFTGPEVFTGNADSFPDR